MLLWFSKLVRHEQKCETDARWWFVKFVLVLICLFLFVLFFKCVLEWMLSLYQWRYTHYIFFFVNQRLFNQSWYVWIEPCWRPCTCSSLPKIVRFVVSFCYEHFHFLKFYFSLSHFCVFSLYINMKCKEKFLFPPAGKILIESLIILIWGLIVKIIVKFYFEILYYRSAIGEI